MGIFFTKHRENGLKLTDFCILPSSSSEACIAEYVRIPSYKYEYTSISNEGFFLEIALSYVLYEASYWRLILIEYLRY